MLNERLENCTRASQQVWRGRAELPDLKCWQDFELFVIHYSSHSVFSSEDNYLLALFCLAHLVSTQRASANSI